MRVPRAVVPSGRIQVGDVSLVEVWFRDRTVDPDFDPEGGGYEEGMFEVRISLARPARRVLAVAMSMETGEDSPVEVRVCYVAEFEMSTDVPEEEWDGEWRRAASQLAPKLLYPHLREMFTSLSTRARGGPLMLPMAGLDLDISEDELAIPPYVPGELPFS